jgi:MFS-type transporter involved in bile tolerance (Atg22 family)
MFKKILGGFKELKATFKDERKKSEFIANILTSKKMIIYGLTCNVIGVAYFMGKVNQNNYDLSMSRWVSRKVGKVGDITIPTFLRKYVYAGYMKMYDINKEEILDQNLENYKTIKEFFIRKIDVSHLSIFLFF